MSTPLFDGAWVAMTLSASLVAGLVLGFAVVVMPGLATLSDRDFLRAFQQIDRVIQDRQPVFMLIWVGSIGAALLVLVVATFELFGVQRALAWMAGGLYLLAVQGPTVRFNIPLNNAVQALQLDAMTAAELAEARAQFEGPWNRWNRLRTSAAVAAVAALLLLKVLAS